MLRFPHGFRTAVLSISFLVASGVVQAQSPPDILASFGPTDPQAPMAPLIQGTDGNFYGTTPQGGAANVGTVFRMTPDGAITIVYSFSGGLDGGAPYAGLIEGTDGSFYGTASQGGAANAGTIFQITPSGGFTVLYSFFIDKEMAKESILHRLFASDTSHTHQNINRPIKYLGIFNENTFDNKVSSYLTTIKEQ